VLTIVFRYESGRVIDTFDYAEVKVWFSLTNTEVGFCCILLSTELLRFIIMVYYTTRQNFSIKSNIEIYTKDR